MVRAVGWDGWDRSANLGQSRVWDPKPGEQQKDWGGVWSFSPCFRKLSQQPCELCGTENAGKEACCRVQRAEPNSDERLL